MNRLLLVPLLVAGCVSAQPLPESGPAQLFMRSIAGYPREDYRANVQTGTRFEVAAPEEAQIGALLDAALQEAQSRHCTAALDRGLYRIPKGVPHLRSPLDQELDPSLADKTIVVWEFFCVNKNLGIVEPLATYTPGHSEFAVTDPAKVATDGECRLEEYVGSHSRALACVNYKSGRIVAEASLPYVKGRQLGPKSGATTQTLPEVANEAPPSAAPEPSSAPAPSN